MRRVMKGVVTKMCKTNGCGLGGQTEILNLCPSLRAINETFEIAFIAELYEIIQLFLIYFLILYSLIF